MENTIDERAKAADNLSDVRVWEHEFDGAFYWFAARTLRGARMAAREYYAEVDESAGRWAQGKWSEVAAGRMNELKVVNDVGGPFGEQLEECGTYREYLDKLKAAGKTFPRFFATSEN